MSAEILLLSIGAVIGGVAVGIAWLVDRWFAHHYPNDEV